MARSPPDAPLERPSAGSAAGSESLESPTAEGWGISAAGPRFSRTASEEAVGTAPAKPTTVVTFAVPRQRMPPFGDAITCELSKASDPLSPEDPRSRVREVIMHRPVRGSPTIGLMRLRYWWTG